MSGSIRRLRSSPGLVLRLAWGAMLVLKPAAGVRALGGRPTADADWVMRVLGARHLIQGGLELRHGRWRRAGGVVDLLHAASAAGFGQLDDRWRRVARADALAASGFALLALVAPPADGEC